MPRRKPAEDRKAEIVAALLVLADQIGPDRLTTNDIAQAVGLTQAAIFRHFPTKAELWAAAGETIALRLQEGWQRALAENPEAQARLRALIATQLRQIEATPALPAILHSRELNAENAALRARFMGVLEAFQAHLVACLTAIFAAAKTPPALSAQDAAVLLTSLVQGMAMRWSLGARSFSIEAEGLRLLDVQLRLFTSGEWPE